MAGLYNRHHRAALSASAAFANAPRRATEIFLLRRHGGRAWRSTREEVITAARINIRHLK